MNSLSWFIYAAEVVPSIATLLSLLATACTGGFVIYMLTGFVINEGDNYLDTKEAKERKRRWWSEKQYLPSAKQVSVVATLFLLSILIPSKETMYLIAGSEVGETVVASEEGKEVLSDVKEILDIQLEKLKK